MENKWAADHLQTIRTLMERSALYRRTLAPIMLISGAIGLAAAAAARWMALTSPQTFVIYWMAVAAFSTAVALVLTRRQALKDAEPFWSLPTQRVASSLFPCFLMGLGLGIAGWLHPSVLPPQLLASLWILTYGCALRAAGFFVQRGIRLFGNAYLAGGTALLLGSPSCPWLDGLVASHCVMGTFFGAAHLAYGTYLYFTERKSPS